MDNFAGQWLQLRNLRNVQPNSDLFPDFDDNLRQSFRRETELLFESMVQEDRSVLDLLTADYTFVNERLARHYGIPNIYGSRFRRVAITDDARRGLLGQGSILALTSHAERTSPVVRGKWILENILGSPVPPPPPDVPPLKGNQEGQKPRTMREQMAEHRANPVCAGCHKAMDSDRLRDGEFRCRGRLANARRRPADRRHGRACRWHQSGRRGDIAECAGEPSGAVCRHHDPEAADLRAGPGLDYRDMPTVRAILRDAGRDNYRFSAIVLGVVHSTPFQMRIAPRTARPAPVKTAENRKESRACSSPRNHLSRRTMLRGVGAAVSLPLLDAMLPAFVPLAKAAAKPKMRFGAVYFPNGAIMQQLTPKTVGTVSSTRRF